MSNIWERAMAMIAIMIICQVAMPLGWYWTGGAVFGVLFMTFSEWVYADRMAACKKQKEQEELTNLFRVDFEKNGQELK